MSNVGFAMENKYEGLNKKSPIEAAAVVGEVEKRAYLAHSILEIENALSRPPYNARYRVITHVPKKNSDALILFHRNCCAIFLPSECEKMNDKKIRLTLAHELGHLIYNFDRLDSPNVLDNNKPTPEEEAFAWEFAYHLIWTKSEHHFKNKNRWDFIYTEPDLKKAISEIIKEKNVEVYSSVAKSLKLLS